MHNNVKFVLRDEDIQLWWEQMVLRFILCLSACPGDGEVKKIAAHPLRIISGTALNSPVALYRLRCSTAYSV